MSGLGVARNVTVAGRSFCCQSGAPPGVAVTAEEDDGRFVGIAIVSSSCLKIKKFSFSRKFNVVAQKYSSSSLHPSLDPDTTRCDSAETSKVHVRRTNTAAAATATLLLNGGGNGLRRAFDHPTAASVMAAAAAKESGRPPMRIIVMFDLEDHVSKASGRDVANQLLQLPVEIPFIIALRTWTRFDIKVGTRASGRPQLDIVLVARNSRRPTKLTHPPRPSWRR
jgi:hypothetical protein